MTNGTEEDILQFLKEKNIFDVRNFNISDVLWMLKKKENYQKIIRIFRDRQYYNEDVWRFALLHGDQEGLKELFRKYTDSIRVDFFEYFPLSSNRAHKFMNEGKTTILNREFKQTYRQFLLSLALRPEEQQQAPNLIVFSYYLLLQDRVHEAADVFRRIRKEDNALFPQLQYDYLHCYLDMVTGYPNFVAARELSDKYKEYPVLTWRKLFREVYDLLNSHDSADYFEPPKTVYDIRVVEQGDHLKVSLPEDTRVQLHFHAVNVELLFSQSPFLELNVFSVVKPFRSILVTAADGSEQKVPAPGEHRNLYVQAVDVSLGRPVQKIEPFYWTTGDIKARVLQDQGVVQAFVKGKSAPGVYCKVFVKENGNKQRFLKDGYTDIQGRFRYITSDISNVTQFAILVLSDTEGGIVKFAGKPNQVGTIA